MSRPSTARRRPSVHITLARAARLHHLVRLLTETPRTRDAVLSQLGIGLRTFYRELELLQKCGVKVQFRNKLYGLLSTAEQAEGRLPFPDPQLSFAEMAELAQGTGDAARRLSQMLDSVVNAPVATRKGARGKKGAKPRKTGSG